jgi:hypothetical protein
MPALAEPCIRSMRLKVLIGSRFIEDVRVAHPREVVKSMFWSGVQSKVRVIPKEIPDACSIANIVIPA